MSSFQGSAPAIALAKGPGISHRTLLGILWSGAAFSILIVGARLAIRLKLLSHLKVDDYLVIFAMLCNLGTAIIWSVLGSNLYLTLDSISQDDGLSDPMNLMNLLDKTGTALHANLASFILMWTCLWSIKLSFMAFFYGLGNRIKSQRILWWAVLAFVAASYLVCIGVLDYQCMTSNGFGIITTCFSQHILDREYAGTRVAAVLDIITDILLITVSGNIVWRARIQLNKKLALAFICSLTVFMVVVAIVRVAGPADSTWLLLWNSIEMTVAIFVACIASFRSLYTHTKSSRKDNALALQQLPRRQRSIVRYTFNKDAINNEYSLWVRQASQDDWASVGADQKATKTEIAISPYEVS
ncbi:hypothetical protein F4677DRAFT_427726 [Hypoxylon crocopeplum]|nr:hypothetical protein F4677DRAFT_427726 [Hypoxylon crocopeplum]